MWPCPHVRCPAGAGSGGVPGGKPGELPCGGPLPPRRARGRGRRLGRLRQRADGSGGSAAPPAAGAVGTERGPGKATRWLARRAALVCTAFEESGGLLRCRCPIRVTGNPVRAGFCVRPSSCHPRTPPHCNGGALGNGKKFVEHHSGSRRQRRRSFAQRERTARLVQDSRASGRLEDCPPIGRIGTGCHADAVCQARPAGHGRTVSERHAGGAGGDRSGGLSCRRHDAGRTGGRGGSRDSPALSARRRRSPGGQRPAAFPPAADALQSTSATCPGGSTINWPTCYASSWPTTGCASGCRRPCASWPGPTRPTTWQS